MTKRLARLAASTSLLVAATMPASTAFSAIVVTKAQSTHRLLPGSTKLTAVRDPATHAPLSKLLASAVNRAQAPGGVFLVKTPAWSRRTSFGAAPIPRSFGTTEAGARVPMPVNGRFRVGGITATFTATLVLQLVEAGVLSLDDTVERWLPGRLTDDAGTGITIRDLLRHRSGLQDAPLIFAGLFSVAGPPGAFYYANANYTLLGEIIAAATDSSYEEQLKTRVLDPFGLTKPEVARGPVTPAGLVHCYSPKPANGHAGAFSVSLRVTDGRGASATVSREVTVTNLAPAGHVEAGAAIPRQTRPSSHDYRDARLDTPSAPDITSVAVAIDGSRWLTLTVSFANRSGLLPSDLLVVGLDVDRDRRTGGPMGMDYALSATTAGAELGVWNSSSWTGSGYVPIPGAATLSVSGHSVGLSTPVGQLGALMESPRPKLRFVLIAIANFDQPEATWTDDVAGPWTYQLKLRAKPAPRKS
jgi:CubicO group peptidase (beta-lactamase class C family)